MGGVLLVGAPGLVHAAPAGAIAAGTPGAQAAEERVARERAAVAEEGAARAAEERATEESEERAVRERSRTWQIYQQPLPGAEHTWGPPNGQMPAVAEVVEEPPDPRRAPPTGTARIAVGAVVGAAGLAVFGLGIAARTTDVFGEDRRAAVPLLGAGLVTAAIGWGLFAHGILRRGAYLRWKKGQATVSAGPGGAALVLRF